MQELINKSVNRILIMNVLFFIVFSIFCNISYANEDDASERLSSLTDLGATILPFDTSKFYNLMLSCKNNSSTTKEVKLNLVTKDSVTPYQMTIKKNYYLNKYIRDIISERGVNGKIGLLSIENDENIECFYKGVGVNKTIDKNDISSKEAVIVDNVKDLNLTNVVHHQLLIYNLGLNDEDFTIKSYLENGTLESEKTINIKTFNKGTYVVKDNDKNRMFQIESKNKETNFLALSYITIPGTTYVESAIRDSLSNSANPSINYQTIVSTSSSSSSYTTSSSSVTSSSSSESNDGDETSSPDFTFSESESVEFSASASPTPIATVTATPSDDCGESEGRRILKCGNICCNENQGCHNGKCLNCDEETADSGLIGNPDVGYLPICLCGNQVSIITKTAVFCCPEDRILNAKGKCVKCPEKLVPNEKHNRCVCQDGREPCVGEAKNGKIPFLCCSEGNDCNGIDKNTRTPLCDCSYGSDCTYPGCSKKGTVVYEDNHYANFKCTRVNGCICCIARKRCN